MSNITYRRRDENVYQIIEKNDGLVVVYGVTCADILCKQPLFHIDYFVDRRAGEIKQVHGITVIDAEGLRELAKKDGRRVTIIICIGMGTATATSNIYEDIVKLDINADVFDFFANNTFFANKSFRVNETEYLLYQHPYNCGYANTRMTERAVELALAEKWIAECEGSIIEIGAVTPYYFKNAKIREIIDPMDPHHLVTKNESVFECDLTGMDVLSISTVEHIGVGDYGFTEKHTAVEGIEKILKESNKCLITVPFGFNKDLDDWVLNHRGDEGLTILSRGLNNGWKELSIEQDINGMFYGVNGLIIIEK